VNPERRIFHRLNLQTYFPILILGVLVIAFSLLAPRFFRYQNFMIILQQAVVLLVSGLGMTIVIIGGSIDLSVGSVVGLTALVTAMAAPSFGVFAIVPGALVGALTGLITGFIFAKGKVPSFIVTVGGLVAYRGVVLYLTRGAPVEITNMDFLEVFGGRFLGFPRSVMFAIILVVVAAVILEKTPFGREVRAIGGGERVADLTGVRVDRVKILIFVWSGLMAGFAGGLQAARVFAATSQLGEGLELQVISAVVLGGTPLTGGTGGIRGTIIGALIIGVLSNGMNMMGLSPYIQNIVQGIVLIMAVFATIDREKIGVIK